MTTKTNEIKNSVDGTECSSLLGFFGGEYKLPASWARQDTNEGARLLIHTILPIDGIPMEGSSLLGYLRFQGELDGLGYAMTYEAGAEDELGFARVSNVHVYRDSVFDREDGEKVVPFEVSEACDELFEDVPAVTFDTIEEYEQQCERCTQCGYDRAAQDMWETLKAEAEDFWKREERLRDRSMVDAANRCMRTFKAKLDTYEKVFAAMGAKLVINTDWTDATERVWEIRVYSIDKVCVSGCLRSWAKSNW